MLGSPILYLKGMRTIMFQLSGFYCKPQTLHTTPMINYTDERDAVLNGWLTKDLSRGHPRGRVPVTSLLHPMKS